MAKYNPSQIEPKWQEYWLANKTFRTGTAPNKPKYYCLDMSPYPSGDGLHVGHPEGYTATDIICRYKRSKGFNVLHPMGWDAFGLPAEQYAIETKTHPRITTEKNCNTFRRQIQSLGLSYDWDREINTTDPKYVKWTQWIFIQLYNTWFDEELQKGRPIDKLPIPADISAQGKEAINAYIASRRLAYYDAAQVWWCGECRIVCSNEEVLNDGSHEKCGHQVERKALKQWQLRIPLYAERLLQGLDDLDWPAGIKDMQRNWIGKSHGAEVDFAVAQADGSASEQKLRVYTTRPDTLFGATYMVIAPEHPLVDAISTEEQKASIKEYQRAASLKSDMDRTELAKEKTGVFTGTYAINPVNQKLIPIWVADYVLTGYGTGAIMAVPAHDTRDFEFAETFDLPVQCILEPDDSCDAELKAQVLAGKAPWTEDGTYINSSNNLISLDGLSQAEGIAAMNKWLEEQNMGQATVNYKIRDWLFSRQRYWGEPFPVIHWEDGSIELLDEKDLPLELPELTDYLPGESGESPLSNAREWVNISDPKTGRTGRRETNTMPQWAGSCWYYLRYIDPHNDEAFVSPESEQYWMPVDLYVGGAEHAVLHLLYSRFWHKVLYDLGLVSTDEPYQKLFNQGMILAFAYEDELGAKVPSDLVREEGDKFYHIHSGKELKQIVAKMSKSLRNVVNPDDVVEEYGADSLRLYEMFMGPLEATKPWQSQGLEGMYRFLSRAWRAIAGDADAKPEFSDEKAPAELLRIAHQSIIKVSEDIENLHFNTAISQLMVFNNELLKNPVRYREICEIFVKLLHPFAPHLAEELWAILGHKPSLTFVEWPTADASLAVESTVEVVFQVNGRVRARVQIAKDTPNEELEAMAKDTPRIQEYLEGMTIIRSIVVPGKLVNFVVKPA